VATYERADEESHSPPWSPVTTERAAAFRTPWCDVQTAGAFAQVVEFEIDHLAQAVWRPVGRVDERLERHSLDEREQAPSFCRWIGRRLDSPVSNISCDEAGDALDSVVDREAQILVSSSSPTDMPW
jgi:hypothetical protein